MLLLTTPLGRRIFAKKHVKRARLVERGQANTQCFPFLNLPPAIRGMVYRYIFDQSQYHFHSHIGICTMSEAQFAVSGGHWPSCLSILQTCHQIYQEAFHIFYRYNTLHFLSTDDMKFCLKSMGHARRQEIRSISFQWIGHDLKGAFRILKTCSGLKKIRIHQSMNLDSVYDGFEKTGGYLALREVRGLEYVETVRLEVISTTHSARFHRHIVEGVLDPLSVNDGSLAYYMIRPRLAIDADMNQEVSLFQQPRLRIRATEAEVLLFDQIPWKRRIALGKSAAKREADAKSQFDELIHEQYWKL